MSPTEILNILPPEWRPWALVVFLIAGAIFFWLRWTDTIPQGSLGIRSSAGAIKLRYDKKKYSKAEIARQKAVDEPLVLSGQPAKYGRPKIWQPGLHLQVMVYHKFIKVVAQDQPYDVDDILVTNEEGYRGTLFSQVKVHVRGRDVYLMHTASSNNPDSLKSEVNTQLTRIMKKIGYAAGVDMSLEYQQAVADELQRAVRKRFKQLGVELVGLDLGTAVEKTELTTGRAVSAIGRDIAIAQLAAAVDASIPPR